MRVLITGATGPIGVALVELLLSRGDEILVLVNPGSNRLDALDILGVSYVRCALSDLGSFTAEGHFDVFIHMAWNGGGRRDDLGPNMASLQCSIDALELAAELGCHTFISTGSQAEVGFTSSLITEHTACNPTTIFGAAKLAFHHMAEIRAQSLGVRYVNARIFSIYGPSDRKDSMISYCLTTLMAGKIPGLSSCNQIWNFLFTYDCASAIVALVDCGHCNGVYCLGSNENIALREYVAVIETTFGLEIGTLPCDTDDQVTAPNSIRCDPSRIQSETGWKPVTSFEEGIRRTILDLRG